MELTKDLILGILPECKTKKDLVIKLGYNYNGGTKRIVRNKCKEFGIDLSVLDEKLTREKYELNPKYCLNCGKVLPYEKRINNFCDSSCSASFNNKMREKKEKVQTIKQNKVHFCKCCGKQLSGKQTVFCSNICNERYKQKEYIKRWKNGEETGLSGEYGLSNRIRKYLLEKVNYSCEKCGWGERNKFTNTIPLEVHHIDGDYRNNKEENLQVLCPNCHSLTETFKSHNKEGRKGRDKYSL